MTIYVRGNLVNKVNIRVPNKVIRISNLRAFLEAIFEVFKSNDDCFRFRISLGKNDNSFIKELLRILLGNSFECSKKVENMKKDIDIKNKRGKRGLRYTRY